MNERASKVWLITGTTSGFGRVWATAALERGDRVAATSRDPRSLAELAAKYGERILPMALDVTDRDAVFRAVDEAAAHFDGLDVVVNNAGYGQYGFVEELAEAEVREQFDTNLFGPLWVTQAALRIMRPRAHGRILQISSIGGVRALPDSGAYNASKWALEGLSQSLAAEVERYGIHVTIVEPGGFVTRFIGSSQRRSEPLEAYAEAHEEVTAARSRAYEGRAEAGGTAEAILAIVDAENPPLRVFLGSAPFGTIRAEYEKRIREWERWQWVSEIAQG